MFLLVKPIIQVVLSISPIQHREKIATLPILLITRCQYGNYQSMWRKEENIFYQEVDVVKNKIWRMLQWTVAGRSQMYCPASRVWGNWWRLRFKRWVQGSPMTCALMVSSLMLSACFIYDKRARVIYFPLSWHWYIFETSNLSDRIGFIMFPVANEKQRLSVALITRRFL